MSKNVKRAKSAAPKTGKKAKVKLKLITLKPDMKKDILERGGEFIRLRKQGYSQSDVISMYKKAGISVSSPAYYAAIKIAKAPQAVRDAIREGKVVATLVGPFLKKKLSEAQILEHLNDLISQREKHAKFLKKSGFGEGNAKLTTNRVVGLVRAKLEKIQKSDALTNVRGQAVLSFMQALENVRSAEDIDVLVAEYSGKKKA